MFPRTILTPCFSGSSPLHRADERLPAGVHGRFRVGDGPDARDIAGPHGAGEFQALEKVGQVAGGFVDEADDAGEVAGGFEGGHLVVNVQVAQAFDGLHGVGGHVGKGHHDGAAPVADAGDGEHRDPASLGSGFHGVFEECDLLVLLPDKLLARGRLSAQQEGSLEGAAVGQEPLLRLGLSVLVHCVERLPKVVEISSLRRDRRVTGNHGLHIDDLAPVRSAADVVGPVVDAARHHGLAADGEDLCVVPAGPESEVLQHERHPGLDVLFAPLRKLGCKCGRNKSGNTMSVLRAVNPRKQ